MSANHTPRDQERRTDGTDAAAKGTPMAVDLSGGRRTWRMMALFVAGPVIWTVHFLLVYLVVEAGCTGDGPGLRVFDPPLPTIVTLATTVIAAGACLATALIAYRRWHADREAGTEGAGLEPPDRGGTLALTGFLLSLLGFVVVLFVGLPALVLPAC